MLFQICQFHMSFLNNMNLFSNMLLFKPFLTNLLMWMKLTIQLLHSWVDFFIFWTPFLPVMVCDLEVVFNVTWLSQIKRRWTVLLLTNFKITSLLYLFVSSPKTMDFSKRYFFSIGSIQTHTRRNFQKPLNWNCNRSNMKVWCEQYPVDCPQTHIQAQSPIPPPCIEVCDPIRSSWLQFHSFRSVKLKTSLCALCFSLGVCMHQYNRCVHTPLNF